GERAALAARRTAILARIASLRQLRTTAGTGWVRPQPLPPPVAPVPVSAPGSAGQAVAFALAQLGKAYVWGAAGPGTYDCSGLTMAAWRAAGVSLPHNAAQQWRSVAHVTRAELRPGDLIFYYGDIHHVALYLGGGRMVHAPTQGLNVMISPVGLAPIFGYGRPG
ncbi:MAG TPA: C40 family peptidase, partial [Rugosimonospora sp.]|nr:C40 family peptidase [Rugosimonospora sp.]